MSVFPPPGPVQRRRGSHLEREGPARDYSGDTGGGPPFTGGPPPIVRRVDWFTEDSSQGYVAAWNPDHPEDARKPNGVYVTVVNVATCEAISSTVNYSAGQYVPVAEVRAVWKKWSDENDYLGSANWRKAVLKLLDLQGEGLVNLDGTEPLTPAQVDMLQRISDQYEAGQIMAREGII